MQDTHAHTNRLAGETSPYLLQHAHNPVDWYPWGEEAFSKARMENKLVLISIGYSSCHWCHVMERESFENDSIARYMNEHFINIKVDREERPDVDQVYMAAVQLMTGRGGWPLNCFALPDGRPVYGGTYYPPAQWKQVLQDLQTTWKQEPERVKGYAERLSQGVAELDLVLHNEDAGPFQARDLERYVDRWETEFDRVHGGPDRAPKFPMPNNLMYLLDHGALFSDTAVLAHVRRTLDKMAMGGIFDQAGGGFARYSTDVLWKAPHFEKMLYDNAQLVSLYSRAWQAFKDPLYQQVVERTLEFIAREMTAEPGVFHSALDADTEGEEGRYYVWTRAELQAALGLDMSIAEAWYDLPGGLWEEDRIILLRRRREAEVARELAMSPTALAEAVDRVNGKLLEVRERRERPGLDDKSLTSWNALMAIGYCDAYAAFGREEWLRAAEACLTHIITKRRTSDGGLAHTYKQGRATINGYLEDYCFTLEALLALYSITFEERWLREAEQLTTYVIEHFSDARSGMFHFTSDLDPPLIARKMEVSDNVIPASNSSMAHALLRLGHLFERPGWLSRSEQMLQNVKPQMEGYPSGYSNWALLMLAHVKPLHEIVITGPECREKRREFGQHHLPNTLFVGAVNDGSLPLLEQRFLGGTTIFVCQNKSCQLPVSTVPEALKQLR